MADSQEIIGRIVGEPVEVYVRQMEDGESVFVNASSMIEEVVDRVGREMGVGSGRVNSREYGFAVAESVVGKLLTSEGFKASYGNPLSGNGVRERVEVDLRRPPVETRQAKVTRSDKKKENN